MPKPVEGVITFTLNTPPGMDLPVRFYGRPNGNIGMTANVRGEFNTQQIGELGALLLALAGDWDTDSAVELLDGYGFTPESVHRMQQNLLCLAGQLSELIE